VTLIDVFGPPAAEASAVIFPVAGVVGAVNTVVDDGFWLNVPPAVEVQEMDEVLTTVPSGFFKVAVSGAEAPVEMAKTDGVTTNVMAVPEELAGDLLLLLDEHAVKTTPASAANTMNNDKNFFITAPFLTAK